ncbi:STAS domain-containing protein [Dokdonella sp.]|uniref:STAS domain-containing protein n=1 Tax=Dokdonella sp. TaxID=2291710 RepID=UPI0031C7F504|nr:STAS domain-containing protein [Dokdonella sp.]
MTNHANTVETEQCAGHVLVRLGGEVDLSWSQDVRRAVLAALQGGLPVGVDLAAVDYIDSSGIAALVEGLQGARSRGVAFALIAVSAQVRAVLELARLDRVFTLAATTDEAFAGP